METEGSKPLINKITLTNADSPRKSPDLPIRHKSSNSSSIAKGIPPIAIQLIPHHRPKSQLRLRMVEYFKHDPKSKDTINQKSEDARIETEPAQNVSFFQETDKMSLTHYLREQRAQLNRSHDVKPHGNILDSVKMKQNLFKQRRKFVENRANAAINQMINKALFRSYYEAAPKTEPAEPIYSTPTPFFLSPKAGFKFDPAAYPIKTKKLVLPENTPSYNCGPMPAKLNTSVGDAVIPRSYVANSPLMTMKKSKKPVFVEPNSQFRSLNNQKALFKLKNVDKRIKAFHDAYLSQSQQKNEADFDSGLRISKVEVKPYYSELESKFKLNTSNEITTINARAQTPEEPFRPQTSHGRSVSPSQNVLALSNRFDVN